MVLVSATASVIRDRRLCLFQADVTDNTPIFILGGNILPFGQGGMTTTEARTSPLTLIVALANATATNGTDRCSGKCPVQQASCLCTSLPIPISVTLLSIGVTVPTLCFLVHSLQFAQFCLALA